MPITCVTLLLRYVGEKEISHIGKNNGNLDLLCEKSICNKAYQNLYFMVIKFINTNELLENLVLVVGSKDSRTLYKGWI